MQEVVIYSWCDVHAKEYEAPENRVEAEHHPLITIDGMTRSLDLCPSCYAEIVHPVLSRMEAYGTRDDAKGQAKSAKSPKARPQSAPVELRTLDRVLHDVTDPVTAFDIVETPEGRVECLFCPLDLNSFSTLYHHMEVRHSVDIASRIPPGEKAIIDGVEVDVSHLICLDCRAEGKDRIALNAQGLGAHRRRAHHVVGTSDWAERVREKKATTAA